MKQQENIRELFFKGLKDIYNVEKHFADFLEEPIKMAFDPELAALLNVQLVSTQKHLERLEKIFNYFNSPPVPAEKSIFMFHIAEEIENVDKNSERSPARDAAITIHLRKATHFIIAVYSSLCEMSDVLGFHRAGDLLARSLDEGEDMDDDLADLFRKVNNEAFEMNAVAENETILKMSSQIHNPVL